MLDTLKLDARSRRWSARASFLRRSNNWWLNGKIVDHWRLPIRHGRVATKIFHIAIDGLRPRIRARYWSRQRRRTNDDVERFALLHFEIIQLHRCARTATLLPSYGGDFLLSTLNSRAISPERIKSTPSIIAWRLGRCVF
jgi:hypothetical protein